MKTVVFYYVRHGKTEFNKQGIMQGQVDSPLVKEGLPVLERDAFVLKDVPFQRCFSSPLYRAVNTAEIILKDRNIPIEPLDDLIEMNFGDIDGKPHKDHKWTMLLMHVIDNFHFIHGESASDVRKRAGKAFKYMYDQCNDGDHVLVAGHGSFYMYMLEELLHQNRMQALMSLKPYGIPNGFISVITCTDGEYKIVSYPQTAEEFDQSKGIL